MTKFDQLDALHDYVWHSLRDATQQRHNRLREAVFATTNDHSIAQRIVIIRRAEVAKLSFHTDIRSHKVQQIQNNSHCSMLCYDHQLKLQCRLRGTATVEQHTPLWQHQWQGSKNFAKRCYLAPHSPGSPSDSPSANLPLDFIDRVPSSDEAEAGLPHFSVVTMAVTHCEVLHLHHQGHRAARFHYEQQQLSDATWLHP